MVSLTSASSIRTNRVMNKGDGRMLRMMKWQKTMMTPLSSEYSRTSAEAVAHSKSGRLAALLNKAIKAYPELERDIEEKIAATGQYL